MLGELLKFCLVFTPAYKKECKKMGKFSTEFTDRGTSSKKVRKGIKEGEEVQILAQQLGTEQLAKKSVQEEKIGHEGIRKVKASPDSTLLQHREDSPPARRSSRGRWKN